MSQQESSVTHFHGPQFIVNSEGSALNLSLPDKTSVTSHPFHGGLSQQWMVQEDGNGGIALMSRYNRTYVTPKDTQGTTLVAKDVPFWFEAYQERTASYSLPKLVVPNTDLGLNLADGSATLSPLSRVAALFILPNTPKSQQAIVRGQLVVPLPLYNREAPGLLSSPGNAAHIFTSNDTKNLVINTGHSTNPEPSPSVTLKASQANTNTLKLVISQSVPVPTANLGTADIIGFGMSGVSIVRNNFNVQKREVLPNFGYDSGWRVDKHVRLLADTTGNKRLDIVGFGETGVWISRNNDDNTFQQPRMVLSDFAYAEAGGGWRIDQHLRFVADIRNTGRADIVGFGNDGVSVSLNKGDGEFTRPKLVLRTFGYHAAAGGWRMDKHLRFLADINGNGLLDIVGFGDQHVLIAYNNGDGTFQPAKPVLADLCHNNGWRIPEHPRFVADMTGDGKLDLVGFADYGVFVAFNNGDGTFQNARKVSNQFCRNSGGWVAEKYPRVIADLTGNGCGDIIGFGEAGVYVAINNGNGTFQGSKLAFSGFAFNGGWTIENHPRFLVDLTGTGQADIVGFGNGEVYVAYNDGKGGFMHGSKLIDGFGVTGGQWSSDKTVRYVANIYG